MPDSPPTITILNRKWLFKMTVVVLVLLALGVWGLWDAKVVYPRKGRRHAQFMLMEYLGVLETSGRLLREADVVDPAGTFAELAARHNLAPDGTAAARLVWLTSLSRIHDLAALSTENQSELDRRAADPSAPPIDTITLFNDPRGLHDQLVATLSNQSIPSALNAYDIPFQYILTVLGFGGGLLLIGFVARCKARRFRFDPESHTLTLPGGRSFTPDQIEKVDKRDWHKFFIHLTIQGFDSELKIDLLRYHPLEQWVLEMERMHPNYEPPEDDGPDDVEPGPPDDPGATPSD